MRHALSAMLLALVTLFVACGGSETRGADPFDTARSDVQKFKGEDGREIGLVNTTYRVVWDYQHGYSRFGADRDIVWGPLPAIPDAELSSMQSTDVSSSSSSSDGVGQTSSALTVGHGGTGGTVGGGTVGYTTCTCCYVRIDGTCGCLECHSY